MGEESCIAYSRCGRINTLHKGRKILGLRGRALCKKNNSTGFLVARAFLSFNPVFRRNPRMGCAGIKAEVRDVKEYEVGLEVSPMGMCFGRVKDDIPIL